MERTRANEETRAHALRSFGTDREEKSEEVVRERSNRVARGAVVVEARGRREPLEHDRRVLEPALAGHQKLVIGRLLALLLLQRHAFGRELITSTRGWRRAAGMRRGRGVERRSRG